MSKNIHNDISNAHNLMGIWVWQFDSIEKRGGKKAYFDSLSLYLFYYRKIIIRGNKYGKFPLGKIAKLTGISLPRLRKARSVLLEIGIIKEARLKDKMGYNKESIVWLPHATKPGDMEKIAKKAGFTFHEMEHKKHAGNPSYQKRQDGENKVKRNNIHPIKTATSHPIKTDRVYNGILKNNRNGILKNKSSKSHFQGSTSNDIVFRNNPPGYKKPIKELKLTDPKHPDNSVYLNLTKRLITIIEKETKINKSSNKLSWATQMRLLCQQDLKVNGSTNDSIKRRVLKALKYHEQSIGDEFALVIHCGASFRKKFSRIEKRMNDANEPKKRNNNSRRAPAAAGSELSKAPSIQL